MRSRRVTLDGLKQHKEKTIKANATAIEGHQRDIKTLRTDEAGFYRFEGVIDGPHRITLNADALPLPWFIEADDKRGSGLPFTATVEVGVRSTTIRNIPARRE
jgi:hypothetical protein